MYKYVLHKGFVPKVMSHFLRDYTLQSSRTGWDRMGELKLSSDYAVVSMPCAGQDVSVCEPLFSGNVILMME